MDDEADYFRPGDEKPKFKVGDRVLYTYKGCTVGPHAGPGFKPAFEGRIMVVSSVRKQSRYYLTPHETQSRWRYLLDGEITACVEFLKLAVITCKEDMERLYD